MASATLVDAAMAATQAAKEEPVPSAWSHMVRKPTMIPAPTDEDDDGTRRRLLLDMARVEGQGHGGHEEARLAVEVVVDQGGVDTGLPGDGPQAGPVVPFAGEDALGRVDDLTPGVGIAGPAAERRPHHRPAPPENGRTRGIHQRRILWYNSSVMNHRRWQR